MWTCPKCHEIIEDQFDKCWKCAAQGSASIPNHVLAWIYPLISLASVIVQIGFIGCFWRDTHLDDGYFAFGGVLIGLTTGSLCVWSFFKCPLRQWFAKILTLFLLIISMYTAIIAVGSFCRHFFM